MSFCNRNRLSWSLARPCRHQEAQCHKSKRRTAPSLPKRGADPQKNTSCECFAVHGRMHKFVDFEENNENLYLLLSPS